MGRMGSGLLTAWALLSATSWAADSQTVPFKLYRGYVIVVRGSIGSLKSLNFLVDTGAVPSVVDPRIASKLQLRGQQGQVDVATKTLTTEQVIVPMSNWVRHMLENFGDRPGSLVHRRSLGNPGGCHDRPRRSRSIPFHY